MTLSWKMTRCLLAGIGVAAFSAAAYGQACGDGDAGDCCEANGTPACNDLDCCETVCAADAFCCDTEWDSLCVGAAEDLCGELCAPEPGACCFPDESCADLLESECSDQGGTFQGEGTACAEADCSGGGNPACGPNAGNCCEANGTVGCDDPDCCNMICQADPFCCETEWDGLCADAANNQCDVCNQPGACCLADGSCVQADGPQDCEGLFQGSGTDCANVECPEPVECPKGTIDEGEPCGQDPDVVNGGCNSTPNVFTQASCGDTFCGLSWADGGTRDTDWYEFTADEDSVVTATLDAPFDPLFATLTGVCGAPAIDEDGSASGVISIPVSAGETVYFFVGDAAFEGNPCGSGNNQYILEFSCSKGIPPGACCLEDATCVEAENEADCMDQGGVFQGPGSDCASVDCPEPFECPKGTIEEGEPCGQDPDVVNGGCNSTPNVFTQVNCGDTICGQSWADGGTRDTDWFELTVDEETEITVTLDAPFDPLFATVTGVCDAPVIDIDGSATGVITTTLPAGSTTYFFVGDAVFEGNPCGSGNNGYTVSFDCGASCTDISECPDIDGSGTVDSADLNVVLGNFGCVAEDDEVCPGDVNCDDTTDSTDLNFILGSFGSECEGDPGNPACGPDAGDCCAPNGTVGCNDPDCCNMICQADAFCCETEWDQLCADAALDQCDVCNEPGACCLPDGSCVQADGPADCAGVFQGSGTDCAEVDCPEPQECPKGTIPEGEPCGQDPDVVNGGCNSTPNVFTTAACGDVFCGLSWADGGTRDTDWYEFTADEDTTVTATLDAPFDPLFATVTGVCGAPVIDIDGSATGVIVVPVSAGETVYFFVGDAVFEGNPCGSGNNQYILEFSCEGGVPPGACCLPDDSCIEADNATDCTDQGGAFQGAGTDCANIDCGASNCCEPNGTPGCDDQACEDLICSQDAFCCDVEWDQLCADAALDQCAVCQ